jgi:hypothetical protein
MDAERCSPAARQPASSTGTPVARARSNSSACVGPGASKGTTVTRSPAPAR